MHMRLALLVITCFFAVFAAGCENTTKTNETHESGKPIEKAESDIGRDDSDFDLLQNYDKDLWGGPAAWSKKQWKWKRTLKWDKQCDYVGDVQKFPTSLGYDIIKILCVPGAYQPAQYLYSFDPESQQYQQLMLGQFGESPQEIIGHISVDKKSNTLSILHLSRGTADCGTLREFQLKGVMEEPKLILTREQACSETNLSESELRARQNVNSWRVVK